MRRKHKHGKGECDRCGFIYKLDALRYEWTGFRVCGPCWDPLPAQDFPRQLEAESQALIDPRPRNDEPASTGRIRGANTIIGRNWQGADLGLTGTEATIHDV